MIFKLPLTTWAAAGNINLESLQSHDSGVLAWMSRSVVSLLKLNMFLMGLLYLKQIIGGSELWKFEGIDEDTNLSLNIGDRNPNNKYIV